jgi:hypothetical protein
MEEALIPGIDGLNIAGPPRNRGNSVGEHIDLDQEETAACIAAPTPTM